MFLFSSDSYPGVELLKHMVVLFLVSCGNCMLFSIVVAPIYIPTNSAQTLPFLHILINTMSCLFDNNNSSRCELVCQCAFDLHFLDD